VQGESGAIVIPAPDAGYSDDRAGERPIAGEWTPGVLLIDRPAVAALSEMFVAVSDRRPRVAAIWGPSGSGLDTAVLTLARAARLHGFVPVDARCLDTYRPFVADRSLFIIERRQLDDEQKI